MSVQSKTFTRIQLEGCKCSNCDTIMFPKRKFCKNCSSNNLISFIIPNKGKIYSFTTIYYPLSHYDNPPYDIGLITLENIDSLVTARIERKNSQDIKINQDVELFLTNFPESGNLPIIMAKII
ncbi:MAG: Zn-ribbon domain-containing OB-fold protein [Candidatus Thorarchaeota archaeon]